MHPVAKCCSLYCSCVMVAGIIFFAILAVMEANHNMFLTRGQSLEDIAEKKNVLYMTMALNLVVMVSCLSCFYVGTKREKEEAERQRHHDLQNAKQGLDIF